MVAEDTNPVIGGAHDARNSPITEGTLVHIPPDID